MSEEMNIDCLKDTAKQVAENVNEPGDVRLRAAAIYCLTLKGGKSISHEMMQLLTEGTPVPKKP